MGIKKQGYLLVLFFLLIVFSITLFLTFVEFVLVYLVTVHKESTVGKVSEITPLPMFTA